MTSLREYHVIVEDGHGSIHSHHVVARTADDAFGCVCKLANERGNLKALAIIDRGAL